MERQQFKGITEFDIENCYGLFGIHDTQVNAYDTFKKHYTKASRFDRAHRLNDKVIKLNYLFSTGTDISLSVTKGTKELKIDDYHSVNETAVRCSDNPIYLGNMLEKLPSELSRLKYDIFALEKGDEIFKLITHEKLKKK